MGAPAGVNGVGLECIVEASPMTHHLFWYKGSKFDFKMLLSDFEFLNTFIMHSLHTKDYSLGSTERYSLTVQKINLYTIKMTLAILNLREEDAGLYRCKAGKSEATIRLYSTELHF